MNDWRHTKRKVEGSNGQAVWIDTRTQADDDREHRQERWQKVFDALPAAKKETFWKLPADEQERLYKLTAAEFAAIMDAMDTTNTKGPA